MIHADVRTSILITLLLLLIAQVFFNPALLSAIFALILLCLFFSFREEFKAVSKIWTFALTILALATIYFRYQSFIGIEAGVAVLSTFLFAKALETKTKRDVIILFNFALFVGASSFLYSQSIWMAIVIILCLFSCLIGLYRLQTSEFKQAKNQSSTLKNDAKHVGKFLILALPFFILLFIFFPRLPPLWHIPIPEQRGVTGMSDSMSPGDIAQLSQSSSLAFRIIGNVNKLPSRNELYWRAMVLDQYDGRTWTSSFVNQQPVLTNTISRKTKQGFDYQYLAADSRVMWIMGLEKSIPKDPQYQLKQDWGISPIRSITRNQPINLHWLGDAQLQGQGSSKANLLEKITTQIPEQLDAQSRQFALEMFQQSEHLPDQYVRNILQWYKKNDFVYTLTPGLLGENRIDEFLFQSRQGFCEHYASSFAMLMRYVGIPARIIIGYQGGQLALDRASWEVRQLDAHAWTEVYLNGKWQRIDPTAIIAPQRIDGGMQNYIENDRTILGNKEQKWKYRQFTVMKNLRIWSDYASYQWQSKVIGYDAEKQQSWLSKLGLKTAYASTLILLSSILLVVMVYFVWIYYRHRQYASAYEHAIQQFSKQLEEPLRKQPAETFFAWMHRLAKATEQDQHRIFMQAAEHYQQQRFSAAPNSSHIKQFREMLKTCTSALKKRRKHLS
ncbi:transglutaminaseTgpA domain-containing protein [Acinetobacter sp. TSRC1-2]|uniref:transglutaminase family protein n=1 Tax=unclassified Acinetobacter TaxID=196816 RepID=UPI003CFAD1ED